VVFATGKGSNLLDVDGNRYVDLAQGFGSMLLGHAHPSLLKVLELQSQRLMQALGDLHPADAKVGLLTRLVELFPEPALAILGQSGADAVTAALKTAMLYTGRPGVVAFESSYHGLSYAPLAASALRPGYREPFASQLNSQVTFLPYPDSAETLAHTLAELDARLAGGNVGAILVEPILGRGGIVVPPADFLPALSAAAAAHGALLIADEIWTGLGRAGKWSVSLDQGVTPDLLLLGKGLGGGLPLSACLGKQRIMAAWSREPEVVHTSTFAGAPLACAMALALLDTLSRKRLVERARTVGDAFKHKLSVALERFDCITAVRGQGLMLGIEPNERLPGGAGGLQRALLERGYVTTTGGGQRDVLVLTPALDIEQRLLDEFTESLTTTVSLLAR
jgi:4-aminobutyrate aminotransferase/(S)-3-amino-2-methylpropionate transaminase